MRPGQAAPDEDLGRPMFGPLKWASMRPGQAAPDELGRFVAAVSSTICFNEAGASSPG